jgi:hypothetical protein
LESDCNDNPPEEQVAFEALNNKMTIFTFSPETRARNKLTITANKEVARIKFEKDLTALERQVVIDYFLDVVENCPMNEHTLRGSIQLDQMKHGMVLYNEPQKNPIRFNPDGTVAKSL